ALLAYTRGGLWRIGGDGQWSLLREDAPPGGAASGALMNGGGELFLVSTDTIYRVRTIHAYNRDGLQQWQAELPDVSGQVTLAQYDTVLLLLSSGGNILTINAASGAVCNTLRVFGGGPVWHSLGDDGILRLAIGAQFTGWDWVELTQECG
ncbi:MAG TPA: hypothetical protein VHO69_02290, partial [Phototrophicaceae bacterium]|nr:hypothetical protein [Phototrophicaceae bacterium]